MSDLQRDLRLYIEHLADVAELDPRSQTAPIPRQHALPSRRSRPVFTLVAAVLIAVAVGWIALDGGGNERNVSTPSASVATSTTTPPASATVPLALPPIDELWNSIAECETGGNWDATGLKYQGGLGIYFKNWDHYGGLEFAPTAGQATREEQIVVAERIRAEHGLKAWGCARTLGYARTDPELYVDKRRGFSITIPSGWGQQQIANSSELFRAQSLELVSTCGGKAVTYAGWVEVRELPKHNVLDAEPRPEIIDATTGTGGTTPSTCQGEVPVATTQTLFFITRSRTMQIVLSFYPGASLANRAEAYEMLNTARFTRPRRRS